MSRQQRSIWSVELVLVVALLVGTVIAGVVTVILSVQVSSQEPAVQVDRFARVIEP